MKYSSYSYTVIKSECGLSKYLFMQCSPFLGHGGWPEILRMTLTSWSSCLALHHTQFT